MYQIDLSVVQRLVSTQFPQWKNLPITPVAKSGWDNRTFHLGKEMLIRLPSGADYALQVEKEHQWLPRLAPLLPLPIPIPLAMGKPAYGYPWKWSIYRWIEGASVSSLPISDLNSLATELAQFLIALEKIDPTGGPKAGLHSFYRAGPLAVYDADTRRAIAVLKNRIDGKRAIEIWERALDTSWGLPPVWVHGDISAGNLLTQKGHLCAVIDFGQLAIGDPACDLTISWTLFKGENREIFRKLLPFDPDTWTRARAWALWKALVVAAGFTNPNNKESTECWQIIDELLEDHPYFGFNDAKARP